MKQANNMSSKPTIYVREIERRDVQLITDYWMTSDADFLISLGVDLAKLPNREAFTNMLTEQIKTPIKDKKSYALIWEIDGNVLEYWKRFDGSIFCNIGMSGQIPCGFCIFAQARLHRLFGV